MRSLSSDRSTFPSFSSFSRIHKPSQSFSICPTVLKQLRGFFCCWTHIYSLHLAISASLPLRSTALIHANVRHTPMLIKESITQCLYLTVLITSIMYRSDRAISSRNQTLSIVYLLHLLCEKRFSALIASRSCGTLTEISEEDSSLQLELLQLTVVIVNKRVVSLTILSKLNCNAIKSLLYLF